MSYQQYPYELQPRKPRSSSGNRLLLVVIIMIIAGLSALIGTVSGGLLVYEYLLGQPTPERAANESAEQVGETVSQQIITTNIDTAVIDAVDKVGPAVVTVVGVVPGQPTFFGRTANQPVSGSGVIISDDGYILTNNHVIEDTLQVGVILADGTELPAEVIGQDSFTDLAVLKADSQFPMIASLGNSDDLRPGETVIAIGSPLGDFKNTVTVGVVSATERSIEVNENYIMEGLIQTDAAINQGNSGGPLVNLAGEVVGLNTLIVRGGSFGSAIAEGLGFAIPANQVQAVAAQLIEQGYFAYPYLGIRYQWFTENIARRYDLPVDAGIYVAGVDPDTPGRKAGLEPGDIIIKIGDQVLDKEHPYVNVLYTYSPGDTTTLTVLRGGQTLNLTVTFEEHPTP